MVEIENKLYSEIKEYCKLNGLVIKDFINKLLKKAFTIEKYGEKPFSANEVVSAPYVPTLEVTLEEPADLPPITNEKNIENGSVIMAPYIVETNGPMIVVNHGEKEKIKKSKKRKL